ncbi:preprotein translocase subunit YajC [Ruminococcus sp. NK3A76]|uniref:preprotein translocase subunit YajC n=1 Tax=Ruminococcus sp. NK3A76 TaxID=877411 RepID=UPI00048A467A|nr:preprotein translocase subunit YajC [Ruminococcus sp. NK3A76]
MNAAILAEAQASSTTQMLVTFLPLALIFVFFYLFILRPQRNQEKRDKAMRENLEIGDEVVTNGGIVGIVFQVKEDTVVIETGGDRSKIRVKKWAIAQNLTTHEDDK